MARVLVVDDSGFQAKQMAKELEKLGHEVVGIGKDGNEGLALYLEHRPDLTTLDITMPNKDGRDCLRDIKKENPDARVIMISAVKKMEIVRECLNLGAFNVLAKPINFRDKEASDHFRSIIDEAIGRKE